MSKNFIHRQSAIDVLNKAIDSLKEMPSGAPDWISVKISLPEEQKDVIVWIHDDIGDSSVDYVSSGWRIGDIWVVDDEPNYMVYAWQEFPKPGKARKGNLKKG